MDSIYENRISRLRKTLAEKDLNVFIVLTEENRLYLSGFAGEDTQFDESAGALIITDKRLILATDPRFTIQAQREASGFEIYIYEKGLPKELPVILKNIDAKKAGFESKRMSFYQYGEMVKEADNNGLVIEFVQTESKIGRAHV